MTTALGRLSSIAILRRIRAQYGRVTEERKKEGNGTQNGKVKRLPPPWQGKHLSFSMVAYAGRPVSVENTLVRQLEQGFKKERGRERDCKLQAVLRVRPRYGCGSSCRMLFTGYRYMRVVDVPFRAICSCSLAPGHICSALSTSLRTCFLWRFHNGDREPE